MPVRFLPLQHTLQPYQLMMQLGRWQYGNMSIPKYCQESERKVQLSHWIGKVYYYMHYTYTRTYWFNNKKCSADSASSAVVHLVWTICWAPHPCILKFLNGQMMGCGLSCWWQLNDVTLCFVEMPRISRRRSNPCTAAMWTILQFAFPSDKVGPSQCYPTLATW